MSWKAAQQPACSQLPTALIPTKKIINWTSLPPPANLLSMIATDPISLTEAELEALVAKYTLEYLYRWTNEFDGKELAQLRQLLASAPPEQVVRMMKPGFRALPN
jgi:hypothetical protein